MDMNQSTIEQQRLDQARLEAYLVGEGKKPVDAYLDIEDIIRIAKEHDIDAIHPGYGFLSENEEFARRCGEEGIIFIGPHVEHLNMFGDKVNARTQAKLADIPMIPGSDGALRDFAQLEEFAETHGYPLMIKAVMVVAVVVCAKFTVKKIYAMLMTALNPKLKQHLVMMMYM